MPAIRGSKPVRAIAHHATLPARTLGRLLAIGITAATAAVVLSGDGLARDAVPMTEVVVTLKTPPLSVFGRRLLAASHRPYLERIDSSQAALSRRIESTIPGATIRWRYRLVANGMAVLLPRSRVAALERVPGVAEVWPDVQYHLTAAKGGPEQIGANKLWGPGLESAGTGMKIGIIDEGIDASHPYFSPTGFHYPPGFPKGQTKYTTPKVIVQRAFPPPSTTYKNASLPFDPELSDHGTHVAGIAAGNHGTVAKGTVISGVAPNAWLGNYKAYTVPTPVGLDGGAAEVAAAVEAAVADGMNVINLSLGEPEVEPSRDLVVKALEGAAAAGVVPVVSAGNDYDAFGGGTISSPANAPDAIAVAAVTSRDAIASFSSAGPTPVSLEMKPDVSAPGVDILSSFPASEGTWATLSGTSMSSPQVAGAAALLKERHPDWTVAQIKSALVQTGDPVHLANGTEAPATREGGGLVDLPRADVPLLFAAPTGLSFGRVAPGATATRRVSLTDAGGGAGDWVATVALQLGSGTVSVPPTVTVPGTLTVTATGGATTGDTTGFVVLTHGTDVRRIPLWFATSAPKLAGEPKITLTKPGVYRGTTVGGRSLVSSYRYPTGGDRTYLGPERVYRVRLSGKVANAGVVVLSGNAFPHVTFDGAEDHLAGYAGLPVDLNPYRLNYGAARRIAGVVLPSAGLYDLVFDTLARGGPFTFRYWVNDVKPPMLRLRPSSGAIVVSATDAGAGVDPVSIVATLDGKHVRADWSSAQGTIRIAAAKGTHTLLLSIADYQEAKNNEDVPPILPNTATLRVTVRVR